MAGRYFGIPFATTGDRITVPDATQPDGSVSFTQGFGFDYERPNTDPAYKPVPRDGTNGLFHDITEALGIAQRQGVSDWTVDAQPYPINALARHTNKVWRSLAANNNVTPVEGASWTEVGALASETVAGIIEIATTAEAQALTDDTTALTPKKLADALLGGNAVAATPAQFDNDTSLATTAFVQRALGNLRGETVVNTSTTLTAANVGQLIVGQTGTYTTTLPLANSVAEGSQIAFFGSTGISTWLVQRQGSDTIENNGGGTFFSIGVGGSAILESNGAGTWRVVFGSVALRNSADFGASLAATGYQKLPGGLIIQWGSFGTINDGSTTVITFPILFPSVCVFATAIRDESGGDEPDSFSINARTASNMTVQYQDSGASASNANIWFAIGY